MKRFNKRIVLVNGLGAIGYLVLLLTWTLFASVVMMGLIDASFIQPPIGETMPADPRQEPSSVAVASTYIITGLAIIASIGVIVALPYLVGRWGSKLIRTMLRAVKTQAGHRTLFSGKLLLLLAASSGMYVTSFFLPPEDTEVYAVLVFGSVCTVLAIIFFASQHFAAKRLRVAIEKVW